MEVYINGKIKVPISDFLCTAMSLCQKECWYKLSSLPGALIGFSMSVDAAGDSAGLAMVSVRR